MYTFYLQDQLYPLASSASKHATFADVKNKKNHTVAIQLNKIHGVPNQSEKLHKRKNKITEDDATRVFHI